MSIADLHCDTISEIYWKRKKDEDIFLKENDLTIDINKLKKSDARNLSDDMIKKMENKGCIAGLKKSRI